MYATIWRAATFRYEVEELVDMEEVNIRWLFGFKEAEERKHGRVRAVEGKKKFHCPRCGMLSLYDGVFGPKVGERESRKREKYQAQWEGQVHGRAPRAACGRCGKVANLDLVWKVYWLGIGEWIRQASETSSQHTSSESWTEIQSGGPDVFDKCFMKQTRELSLSGIESTAGTVQSKIRFFGEQQKKGSNVEVAICVKVDEQVERLVLCTHLRRKDGDQKLVVRCSEPSAKASDMGGPSWLVW